jgi:hypothetical protein
MYIDGDLEKLIGKTVTGLRISEEKQFLTFETTSGEFGYYTDGDCCSISWIEHFEGVENLIGKAILKIEEKDISARPDPDPEDHGCLQIYGFEFTTEKGTALLDFRNDSNGYYGGNLISAKPDRATLPLKDSF